MTKYIALSFSSPVRMPSESFVTSSEDKFSTILLTLSVSSASVLQTIECRSVRKRTTGISAQMLSIKFLLNVMSSLKLASEK